MARYSSSKTFILGFGIAILFLWHPLPGQSQVKSVPSLDELAGQWQDASSLRSLPALNSAHGSGKSAHGVLSLKNVSFPPITMAGDTGALLVDGKEPTLEQARWYPYQVLRKGHAEDISVETAVRMPYEENGVLFHMVVTNTTAVRKSFEVKINLSANTARFKKWGWDIPTDRSTDRFIMSAIDDGQAIVLHNSKDELTNCFAFSRKPTSLSVQSVSPAAIWQLSLSPKSSVEINYALAIGGREQHSRDLSLDWASHFDTAFEKVKNDWQARFDAMFTPKNPYFSGNLPVLVTSDADLRRVYYLSAVSVLSVYRTSFPVAPRVYVSNAPEYDVTMMYFWDTREWATALALLDPAMLKQYLREWLRLGLYKGYAEEYLTGTLEGPVYSANDLSVFYQLNTYLNVTGDRAFLSEMINGKTVLEHMDAIAIHWKSLVKPGRTLADYGGAENLLECVPTYIHEVPSFNAANVWMMRRMSMIHDSEGNHVRAEELRTEASRLLPAVLALYKPGQGVWDSLHRDGSRVEMRHVFDYSTIGLTIPQDLSPQMQQEMTAFVERELLTDHWMRAQSLTDPAAHSSDRPDHGPMGAFSAWPAETMATMCEFGQFDKALDLMHRIAEVTQEGPFSQSRELLGRAHDAPVRIAFRGLQTYYVSSGASFADTVIRDFFGYQPDFLSRSVIPNPGPRGFQGQLLNLRHFNTLLEINSAAEGISSQTAGPLGPSH